MNTKLKTKHLVACALAAAALSVETGAALQAASAAPATDSARAAVSRSTVTIRVDGGDLSGRLSSPRRSCMNNRTVVVVKQIGTRGGGNDVPMFSDTTEIQNGVGVWSTGNSGVAGKFYAKVRRTTFCAADTSSTVTIPEK